MNVHPGEGMDDVLAALEHFVLPLRERLIVPGAFAVGLRLAARAVEENRGAELKAFLDAHDLVAVTANAFPFGDFHGARVKERVYAPDWTTAERADYTLGVACLLAACNAPGSDVSLSTVPVGFRLDEPDFAAAARRLQQTAAALADLESETGVRVRVALEPEPFCALETAGDALAFFRDHLQPSPHLGVCPDTCHHAVRWESGADALDRYAAAGIPVPKIQLSSALEADRIEDLLPFSEPRYLHQVVSKLGEDRLDLSPEPLPAPMRCHFHVPVHAETVGTVRTTRAEMVECLARAWKTDATRCLEIETYTWDVLPAREGELLDSLEAEYRFTLKTIASFVSRPTGS